MLDYETFIHLEDTVGKCLNCGGLKFLSGAKPHGKVYWRYHNTNKSCKHNWVKDGESNGS